MRRKSERHFGFTLVEILVVLLIIGILAGMVMLVAVPATDVAVATKIVNNFKVIQKASIICHAEQKTWWPGTQTQEGKVTALAKAYTDSPNINDGGAYSIWGGSGSPDWGIFLIVDLTKMKNTDNLKSIFKAKANGGLGVQLYDKNYSTHDLTILNPYSGANYWAPYAGGDTVYFCISKSYY